jgi:ribose 5-phosphate isomerase
MDTDDLSREAYNGIIIESEKLTHDLTIRFGVIAKDCKNESEYLDKAYNLSSMILTFSDNQLIDLFWGEIPDKIKLIKTLNKIITNIIEIKNIPIDKLTYD